MLSCTRSWANKALCMQRGMGRNVSNQVRKFRLRGRQTSAGIHYPASRANGICLKRSASGRGMRRGWSGDGEGPSKSSATPELGIFMPLLKKGRGN